MRGRSCSAALAMTMLIASGAANAAGDWEPQMGGGNTAWSGPGWYVEDAVLDVYAGPYASKDDCQAAIAANAAPDAQHAFVCSSYASQDDFSESHP